MFSAQKKRKAKAELKTIILALEQFKSEYDDYPSASLPILRKRDGILFMSLSVGWTRMALR